MAKTTLYLNTNKAPFWFTSDSSIYINFKMKKVEVDLESLSDIAKGELEQAINSQSVFYDEKELLNKNKLKEVILPDPKTAVPTEKEFLGMKINEIANVIKGLQTLEEVEQIAKYELNRALKPRAKVTQLIVEKRQALGAGPQREAADILTPKEASILKPNKD